MELCKNPFYILSAKVTDDRSHLRYLADERSFELDSQECTNALSILLNPRKRLSAELSWFPELSANDTTTLICEIQKNPESILEKCDLPPLAQCNALVEVLCKLAPLDKTKMADCILRIAEKFEKIDSAELLTIVNKARSAAHIPLISEQKQIDAEIEQCAQHYCTIIMDALDKMPSRALVEAVTTVTEKSTSVGKYEVPRIVSKITNAYEVAVQSFFNKEGENINKIILLIKKELDMNTSSDNLNAIAETLCAVVKNWDSIAQPIQVCAKSQGLKHDESIRIAKCIRELYVDSYNRYQNIELSLKLIQLMQEVFAEVDDVVELINKDEVILKERREKVEICVGPSNLDVLRFSLNKIEWKGTNWDVNAITWINWNFTRNGLMIFFGNQSKIEKIVVKNKKDYKTVLVNFIGVLVFPLIKKYANNLKQGQRYTFGNSILHDTGMTLSHGTKRKFFPWSELSFYSTEDDFYIYSLSDKSFIENLSFRNYDPSRILEFALKLILDKKLTKLSDIFEKN